VPIFSLALCGADAHMRDEIASLVTANEQSEDFLSVRRSMSLLARSPAKDGVFSTRRSYRLLHGGAGDWAQVAWERFGARATNDSGATWQSNCFFQHLPMPAERVRVLQHEAPRRGEPSITPMY